MFCILGTIFAGILGLAFGSFLNVCASRWPDDKSAMKGRSYCDHCERELAWWENIPLVSWLALGGRCRTCKEPIGWRHPIVELAVAVLWSATTWQFLSANPVPAFNNIGYDINLANAAAGVVMEWLLVGLAAIDFESLWLPDLLIIPGIVVGFLLNIGRGGIESMLQYHGGMDVLEHIAAVSAVNWFLSTVFAAAVLLVIRWGYIMLRGMEGIGLGDVKLMALLGGWVGFKPALLAFVVGVFLCTGYAMMLYTKTPELREDPRTWAETKLPLGTFLCIGGLVAGFWGVPIVLAFMRWSGY